MIYLRVILNCFYYILLPVTAYSTNLLCTTYLKSTCKGLFTSAYYSINLKKG